MEIINFIKHEIIKLTHRSRDVLLTIWPNFVVFMIVIYIIENYEVTNANYHFGCNYV